jgi:formate dehydrogenase subunit delta
MEIRDAVRMANQIGDFFRSYPEKEALDGIAEHINKFWEPRMRRTFFAHMDAGGEGISEIVKKALPLIKRPKAA